MFSVIWCYRSRYALRIGSTLTNDVYFRTYRTWQASSRGFNFWFRGLWCYRKSYFCILVILDWFSWVIPRVHCKKERMFHGHKERSGLVRSTTWILSGLESWTSIRNFAGIEVQEITCSEKGPFVRTWHGGWSIMAEISISCDKN